VIELFAKADASTFIHESSHLWLDELIRDAARTPPGSQLRKDVDTLLQWFGIDKPENIGRPQHEQWARGFERYLFEGNAPSAALARAFERFKEWLALLYRSLAEFDSPISDDVRAVMDRLLATDPELAGRPTPIQVLADLPPRAAEDAMRVAIAGLVNGEPVRVGEMLEAAAQRDPRIAESVHGVDLGAVLSKAPPALAVRTRVPRTDR
jgi:hypothetical protein